MLHHGAGRHIHVSLQNAVDDSSSLVHSVLALRGNRKPRFTVLNNPPTRRHLNDHGSNRNRKCHLDVRQSVFVCPITAQSLHMLPSRQIQVVIATARDVHCQSEKTRFTYKRRPMTSLLVLGQLGEYEVKVLAAPCRQDWSRLSGWLNIKKIPRLT